MIAVGLTTALFAYLVGAVQTDIKSALSFASLAACSHWTWSWDPGDALVTLTGSDEIPPVRSDGSGSGSIASSVG